MGTQVQNASAQVPATRTCLWRATADCFFYCLGVVLVGVLDYVWVLQRKDRRAWHDLLAGTSVRQIRPAASGKAATAVITAAAVVLLLATSPHSEVAQTGRQRLGNMAPTLTQGEIWEADRLAYRHHPPAVGDLVVFRDWPTGEFVGRVVGLAGDRLRYQQRRAEKVLPTADGWLPQGAVGIPAGAVAVLGDNRASDGSASFPNPRPDLMPMPPPPPPGTSALPAPRPPAGAGNARDNSAIRTVRLADVEGRAVGVIWPLSHLRALR